MTALDDFVRRARAAQRAVDDVLSREQPALARPPKGTTTKPGHYYGVTPTGRLEEASPQVPDAIVCRRVADYAGGRAPDGATITGCDRCAAPIAWNPDGPYGDRPHICLQCAGIEPLPIEDVAR